MELCCFFIPSVVDVIVEQFLSAVLFFAGLGLLDKAEISVSELFGLRVLIVTPTRGISAFEVVGVPPVDVVNDDVFVGRDKEIIDVDGFFGK